MDTTSATHDMAPQVIVIEKPRNGLATAAMVLGIIAIAFSFIPFINILSIVLAVIGLALVIPGFIKARRVKVGMGKAIAALVLGIASIASFTMVNAATVVAIDEAVSEIVTAAESVDVTLGERTSDEFSTKVSVTVENISDSTQSVWVTVAATSPDGSEQYDTSSVVINDLAAGQSATDDAVFLEEIPADAEFVVTDVL
jgi:hypothetical protein